MPCRNQDPTPNSPKQATFHLCAAPQIELNGDIAEVETYGFAAGREPSQTALFGGRYLDRFERRNGVWKIARRTYVLDWNVNLNSAANLEEFLAGLNYVKDRSPNHPLFRRMGLP